MNRLRELRLSHDLKQKDLAAVIKKTPQAYSLYEKGQREMDISTLTMLAEFYKVSVDYILGRTADKYASVSTVIEMNTSALDKAINEMKLAAAEAERKKKENAKELSDLFVKLSPEDQAIVMQMARRMAQEQKK